MDRRTRVVAVVAGGHAGSGWLAAFETGASPVAIAVAIDVVRRPTRSGRVGVVGRAVAVLVDVGGIAHFRRTGMNQRVR